MFRIACHCWPLPSYKQTCITTFNLHIFFFFYKFHLSLSSSPPVHSDNITTPIATTPSQTPNKTMATTTQQPNPYAQHPCTRCSLPSTKACLKCHHAFYCSRKCQTSHHKTHKRTCAALAQAQATRDDEDTRRQRIDAAARREATTSSTTTPFVREFETVQEARRWVREVNELDGNELAAEREEEEERGGE